MKKEIFNTLPYVSRKELIDLRDYLKSFSDSDAQIIYEDNNESELYKFMDYTGQYVFSIQFSQYEPIKKNNIYKVYFCPRNLSIIEGRQSSFTFDQIKSTFPGWVENVIKMNEITKEYYEPYRNFYDEQFADFFTNDDEDSSTLPFEINRQEILFYFLTFAESRIIAANDLSDENKEMLVIEVKYLIQELPNKTKKSFVSALSKFAQKTKSLSNNLFHDIFDVLKKEIIKKVLYKGADQIPNIIHKIDSWMNLLT